MHMQLSEIPNSLLFSSQNVWTEESPIKRFIFMKTSEFIPSRIAI